MVKDRHHGSYVLFFGRVNRYERFHAAFAHIAEKIDPIYKELTKSKTFPLGGTAYLSLEDSEVCAYHLQKAVE